MIHRVWSEIGLARMDRSYLFNKGQEQGQRWGLRVVVAEKH